MRALVLSDLHFEFHRDGGDSFLETLPTDVDVVLLAGDLSDSLGIRDALAKFCDRYEHTVFVFGNHEFYNSGFGQVRSRVADLGTSLRRAERGRLHVLDNSTCEVGGRRFVGTTMWFRDVPGNDRVAHLMNDFHLIEGASRDIYEENQRALKFLDREVSEGDVVLTHHLPARASVHPRYEGASLNRFFLCDVEPLMRERRPALWVHGHTHESCDYVVGTTQVLCNPFGYAGREENPAFREDLVVEL